MRGEIICIYCGSSNIKKIGKRKNKSQSLQRHQCKSCNKTFILSSIKNKSYPIKIILNVISLYNKGYPQSQVSKFISQNFKIKAPQKTISNWINEYNSICTFARIRKQAIKPHKPEEIIFSQKLQHSQIYKYQLHKAKLELQSKELQ